MRRIVRENDPAAMEKVRAVLAKAGMDAGEFERIQSM